MARNAQASLLSVSRIRRTQMRTASPRKAREGEGREAPLVEGAEEFVVHCAIGVNVELLEETTIEH